MGMRKSIATTGLALPPLAGVQLALYLDRCAAGFQPAGPWRDCWGKALGCVLTLGVDAGPVRVRLVLERLRPDSKAEWGWA
jgi:hypothetical protein